MNYQLQKNLIATIREKIPKGKNMTAYLSEKLVLGRESVYRRLRGEINFTFEEIAALSQDLGFSIDNILGVKKNENALFNIHMLQESDYFDIYINKMTEYGRMFRKMSKQPSTKARMAINMVPYFFAIGYQNLSRFRIYKWVHQNQKIGSNDTFSEFVLPEKITKTHKIFYEDTQTVPELTLIMDDNVFWSITKDIEYFMKRGLLAENDVRTLQAELHEMVDMLEQLATNGVSQNGATVSIYISSVDIEASYLHFESDDFQFSQVRIFSISAIDSYNEGLCNIQKEWIESLKKYSVLISGSGEIQRFEYLKKQREYIDKINLLKQSS